MKRNVLITGAAGDTGRAAVKESIKRGLTVRATVRKTDNRSDALQAMSAEVVIGDLHRIDTIRTITFQNVAIDDYCKSLATIGVPAYVVQHLGGAMDDYQHGVMSGMNDNVEKLSGQKPMSVGDFARAHIAELNPQ